MTENVLAARIEAEILAHGGPFGLQKTDQTTAVVAMPVSQDERVDSRGVDLQKLQIVEVHVWCEAEIQQISASLAALLGLNVQRESPLAAQSPALCRGRGPAASRLHGKTRHFRAAQEDVVGAIGSDLQHHSVDDRRIDMRDSSFTRTVHPPTTP